MGSYLVRFQLKHMHDETMDVELLLFDDIIDFLHTNHNTENLIEFEFKLDGYAAIKQKYYKMVSTKAEFLEALKPISSKERHLLSYVIPHHPLLSSDTKPWSKLLMPLKCVLCQRLKDTCKKTDEIVWEGQGDTDVRALISQLHSK